MADDEQKLDLHNEIPIVRHPATGSGACDELESNSIKAGSTSDWELPAAAFKANNPEMDFWQDEETEVFVTTEAGEFIELV
jgi:hypothetical protein